MVSMRALGVCAAVIVLQVLAVMPTDGTSATVRGPGNSRAETLVTDHQYNTDHIAVNHHAGSGRHLSQAENYNYGSISNFDLPIVKASNTDTGKFEIHLLSTTSGYKGYALQLPTAINQADMSPSSPFTFLTDRIGNLYVIKYQGSAGFVELHILSRSSDYKSFTLQTQLGGNLAPSPANVKFALGSNNDLYVFLVGGTTGSGRPEVHVLMAPSYQQYSRHVAIASSNPDFGLTSPAYTSSAWAFLIGSNNDLYLVKYKGSVQPSDNKAYVEVHILSSASNYQTFTLQTTTALGASDAATWTFRLDAADNLYCILHKGTGSNTVEVHILSRSSSFKAFNWQTPTALTLGAYNSATYMFSNPTVPLVANYWLPWVANDGPYFRLPTSGIGAADGTDAHWVPADGCSSGTSMQYMAELNPACNAHDFCYHCTATPGWGINKGECDNLFFAAGNAVCDAKFANDVWNKYWCKATMTTMHNALTASNAQPPNPRDCTNKFPQSYTYRPTIMGFPAGKCNTNNNMHLAPC